MVSLPYILLLASAIGIATATLLETPPTTAQRTCPENEQYTCGTRCIETCDYKPDICTRDCRYGCFCQTGYVRKTNETGSSCVKREDCKQETKPPRCCRNQEYVTCGSACPPSCADLSYPLPKPPKACPAVCKVGCACKKGFYRNEKNRCAAPQDCCNGANEQFSTCGTACPATCNSKPQACTRQCVRGCFCQPGFVRFDQSPSSPCVPSEECPQ